MSEDKKLATESLAELEAEDREKRKKQFKQIIRNHLDRIEVIEGDISRLGREKQILKKILDCFKAGKLDQIEELQNELPEEDRKLIPLTIKKETVIIREVPVIMYIVQERYVQPYTPTYSFGWDSSGTGIPPSAFGITATPGNTTLCINSADSINFTSGSYGRKIL